MFLQNAGQSAARDYTFSTWHEAQRWLGQQGAVRDRAGNYRTAAGLTAQVFNSGRQVVVRLSSDCNC